MIKNNRGQSLLEVVMAAAIGTTIIITVVALVFASMRSWARGSGIAYANADATVAMQKLVKSLREAKSVSISGSTISVTYPVKNADGTYTKAFNGETYSFYLTGKNLYRMRTAPTSGTPVLLSKYLQSVTYTPGSGNVLGVTLVAVETVGNQTRTILLNEKIRLRNAL